MVIYTFVNPRSYGSPLRFPHVPSLAPHRGRFVRRRQFVGDSGGAGEPSEGAQVLHPSGAGAWFFHLVASVEMLAAAHHLIPVMADEIVSTLALAIVAVFLFTFFVYRTVTFGLFALPLAFLLTVVPAIGPERYTFSSPLVRNGWIAFHVVMLLAAYAALLFSMLSSFLYLYPG